MQSILTVTTAATDLLLLTDAELRRATGVASGQDAALLSLNKGIASAITSRCHVKAAGATAPTLRLETLTQVFRLDAPQEHLILARRPLVSITSVVEDAVTVDADDYEMQSGPGFLLRLCNDYPAWWSACKITVVYTAGWETVPENLRQAAMKLAKVLWSESQPGDPNAKRIVVPGVYEIERWVPQGDDPLFSQEINELLRDYINPANRS